MTESAPTSDTLSVLHVDDFDEFLDEFRAIFGQDFAITSARSGTEGLSLLEEREFDAVILDYDMPDMDGLAFLAAAKEKHPLLPVIFCTGQGSEAVARKAFTSGASDYFVKDFSFFVDREKLVHSVRRAVERRRVDEALARERQLLETLIEFNPYSISLFSRDGHFKRENAASRRLWNRDAYPPELVDAYVFFEDPMLLAAGYGPLFERVMQGEAVSFPLISYNPPGAKSSPPRHVSAVAFGVLDPQGQFDTMVVMQEDVTARVDAENALKEAHEALRESHALLERRVEERTAELAAANEALQQQVKKSERLQQELIRKNRELEAFSARVSHDLRNELLVLKKTLEASSDDRPETAERTRALLDRYDHLIQFVERLLSLARAGTSISRRIEMPAEPLVRGLFDRLCPPDVPAELHLGEGAAPIPGDPLTLEHVFSNLISNSFQYRDPSKSEVRLEVDVRRVAEDGAIVSDGHAPSSGHAPLDGQAREVEVTYSDNGRGIDPEHLDRIFDMSFTTDRHNHFGLGLSFAKKIVEAHGGTIRASSAGRGRGATFHIRLPLPRRR